MTMVRTLKIDLRKLGRGVYESDWQTLLARARSTGHVQVQTVRDGVVIETRQCYGEIDISGGGNNEGWGQ